jgi:hypothetical protein
VTDERKEEGMDMPYSGLNTGSQSLYLFGFRSLGLSFPSVKRKGAEPKQIKGAIGVSYQKK